MKNTSVNVEKQEPNPIRVRPIRSACAPVSNQNLDGPERLESVWESCPRSFGRLYAGCGKTCAGGRRGINAALRLSLFAVLDPKSGLFPQPPWLHRSLVAVLTMPIFRHLACRLFACLGAQYGIEREPCWWCPPNQRGSTRRSELKDSKF